MYYLAALSFLPAAYAAPARADLLEAVNWARTRGCERPARIPLHDSARLREAAQRIADGGSLHSALTFAGYRAVQSSEVHLTGAVGDDEVERLLRSNECAALTDANFTEMGVQRRGREVWIVLAAPVALPSLRDAPLVRQQILDLVNRARGAGGRCGAKTFGAAPPLKLNPVLTSAALTHSEDMAAHAEFDHRGHDGSSPVDRVTEAGYGAYAVIGENIAAGVMTPAQVTQGWLDSPPHCENIMDPRFSEIGIAFAVNYKSGELVYWTQDFAAPRRSRGPAGGSAASR